jgi:GH15 family glucan-1,4-alpha-glucosidase
MEKAWNKEGKFFGQSYEDNDVLDSAVLIMPLVFFMHAVAYFLFLAGWMDGLSCLLTFL